MKINAETQKGSAEAASTQRRSEGNVLAVNAELSHGDEGKSFALSGKKICQGTGISNRRQSAEKPQPGSYPQMDTWWAQILQKEQSKRRRPRTAANTEIAEAAGSRHRL